MGNYVLKLIIIHPLKLKNIMKFHITIFFAMALVMTVAAYSTIKCYEGIENGKYLGQDETKSFNKVDCSSGTCLSSTAEVDGHKAVVKSCNPLHMDEEQCIKQNLPGYDVESIVCFCNTDLCNSSTSIVGSYAIFGTMIIFFFL